MSRKLMNLALMYTAITAYASEYPFGHPSPRYANTGCCYLPKGSIKKLIGKELSWKDEPVELKGE